MPMIMPNVGRSRASCRSSFSMMARMRCNVGPMGLGARADVLRTAETRGCDENILQARGHSTGFCYNVACTQPLRDARLGCRLSTFQQYVQARAELRDAE